MNCKEEILLEVGGRELLCAEIKYRNRHWDNYYYPDKTVILPIRFTDTDLCRFLDELDFEYYSACSYQQIFGVIWYTGGSWSEREYDGLSEYWTYRSSPVIPTSIRCWYKI